MTPTTGHLLYLVFALGGVGVYLLLPKGRGSQVRAGAVLGGLALAALISVLATRIVVTNSTTAFFYVFSTIAMLGAVRVITHTKPVYSALYFVLVVISVAALLVLMQAEFLAIALIMVYAGAIMVTYLFVIMLAQQDTAPVCDRRSHEPFLAVLAGFVLMAAVAGRCGDLTTASGDTIAQASPTKATLVANVPESSDVGNTTAIGRAVMTRYIVAFEIAGVLLLVSMVGAIALAKKKLPTETVEEERTPIGQIGREVPPY